MVSMLTRMAMRFDGVAESPVDYARANDYEHEHRDAEHDPTKESQNQAVHLRTACAVLQMENQSSVPGDGNRSST